MILSLVRTSFSFLRTRKWDNELVLYAGILCCAVILIAHGLLGELADAAPLASKTKTISITPPIIQSAAKKGSPSASPAIKNPSSSPSTTKSPTPSPIPTHIPTPTSIQTFAPTSSSHSTPTTTPQRAIIQGDTMTNETTISQSPVTPSPMCYLLVNNACIVSGKISVSLHP